MNFFLYFPHLLTIWVEFGITDMYIILYRNCEFWRNRRRKGRTFLMSISEITVYFESKERVGKVCELRHGHTTCNAVTRNR